jgi:hypothetical protein
VNGDRPFIWEDTTGTVVVLAHVTSVEPVTAGAPEVACVGVSLTGGFKSIPADTGWRDGKYCVIRSAEEKREALLAALRAHLADASA